MRRALSILALTILALPLDALAAPDEVLVLFHGGVTGASRLELDDSLAVVDRGQLALVSSPALLNDLSVMPDGSVLLAGPGEIDVSLLTSSRDRLDTLFRSNSEFSLIHTTTGGAFGAGGGLSRVFFADSRVGAARLLDLNTNEIVWAQTFGLAGTVTDIERIITMPGGLVALAIDWPSLALHGVDVTPGPGAEDTTRVRFTNATHEGQPPETVVIDDLGEVRDLAAADADTLVVTTRETIFGVDLPSRSVAWRIDLGDDPALAGEFASARMLPSGLLAAATFRPGVWTAPDIAHRIHWFDVAGQSPSLLSSSGALQRAPRRVAAADGTGGTGTLGYTAGQISGEPGTIADLVLATGLTIEPELVLPADTIASRISLRNPTERSVPYARVQIRATFGMTCLSTSEDDPVLGQVDAGTLAPGGVVTVMSETPASDLEPGAWCAYAVVTGTDAQSIRMPAEGRFRIDGSSASAPSDELDFERFDVDAGTDPDAGDDAGPSRPAPTSPDGCGCTTTSPVTSPHWLALLAALALAVRPRRRPTRRTGAQAHR